MTETVLNPPWYSSYEENNYGELFYCLMRIYQPEKVVELGTKAGYSAYHMARGLRANGHGTIDCYDLWENYLSDSVPKSLAEKNLQNFHDIVSLNLKNAIGVDKNYDMIDILHIDLDNDGGILEKILPVWIDKIRQFIIIEGGSGERDQFGMQSNYKKLSITEWLNDLNLNDAENLGKIIPQSTDVSPQVVIVEGDKKYKKKPIAKWLEEFSHKRGDIEYFTIEPFPSVTLIRKK